MSPTLDEETTEQIVDELGKRFNGVLVTLVTEHRTDKNIEGIDYHYCGGFIQAAGMASMVFQRFTSPV